MIEMANEIGLTKVSRVFLWVYTYTARWDELSQTRSLPT
jgi:hypothetical protein